MSLPEGKWFQWGWNPERHDSDALSQGHLHVESEQYMSRLVGKPTMWFPNRSNTNQAVQSQKIEAGTFGFRKRSNCTMRVAKTKALISFAVTAKLICAFVFAYADCWFSHAAAHILCTFVPVAQLYKLCQTRFLQMPKQRHRSSVQ